MNKYKLNRFGKSIIDNISDNYNLEKRFKQESKVLVIICDNSTFTLRATFRLNELFKSNLYTYATSTIKYYFHTSLVIDDLMLKSTNISNKLHDMFVGTRFSDFLLSSIEHKLDSINFWTPSFNHEYNYTGYHTLIIAYTTYSSIGYNNNEVLSKSVSTSINKILPSVNDISKLFHQYIETLIASG